MAYTKYYVRGTAGTSFEPTLEAAYKAYETEFKEKPTEFKGWTGATWETVTPPAIPIPEPIPAPTPVAPKIAEALVGIPPPPDVGVAIEPKITLPAGKEWYLSAWEGYKTPGVWTKQPILTVAGQKLTFPTPEEYITGLKELQARGAIGPLSEYIKQFEATIPRPEEMQKMWITPGVWSELQKQLSPEVLEQNIKRIGTDIYWTTEALSPERIYQVYKQYGLTITSADIAHHLSHRTPEEELVRWAAEKSKVAEAPPVEPGVVPPEIEIPELKIPEEIPFTFDAEAIERIMTTGFEDIKKLMEKIAEVPVYEPPSLVAEYQKLVKEAGLDELRTELTNIRTDLTNKGMSYKAGAAEIQAKPIPMRAISGEQEALKRTYNLEVEPLILKEQSLAGQITAKEDTIATMMGLMKVDAETARRAVEDTYTRNRDILETAAQMYDREYTMKMNALNYMTEMEKFRYTVEKDQQDNAKTLLKTVTDTIAMQGIAWTDLTADQQSQLSSLAVASGLSSEIAPLMIASMTPTENTVHWSTDDYGTVYQYIQDSRGQTRVEAWPGMGTVKEKGLSQSDVIRIITAVPGMTDVDLRNMVNNINEVIGKPAISPGVPLDPTMPRTDRHYNPIAISDAKREWLDALDEAGISYEIGDAFPEDSRLHTINALTWESGIEMSRFFLGKKILDKEGLDVSPFYWYKNHTGKEILDRLNINSPEEFAVLDRDSQDDIIESIYSREKGVTSVIKEPRVIMPKPTKPLSADDSESVGGYDELVSQIDDYWTYFQSIYEPGMMGAVEGWFRGLTSRWDRKFSELEAKRNIVGMTIARIFEKGKMSDYDRIFYLEQMPSPGMTLGGAEGKYVAMREVMISKANSLKISLAKGGYNLEEFDMLVMRKSDGVWGTIPVYDYDEALYEY